MPSEMILAPFDAMWREIGCAYRGLEVIRADLKKLLDGVSQTELDRDPGHGIPTIGGTLCHIGLAEAWWIVEIWKRETIPSSWRTLYECGVLKPGALKPPQGVPAATVFAWLDEVRESTRLALMKQTDKDIDRQVIETKKGKASLRWVLHHVAEHEAHHRGQIALLRRLFDNPAGGRRG